MLFEPPPISSLTPSRKVRPAPEQEGHFRAEGQGVRPAIPKTTPVGLCGRIRSVAAMDRLRAEGRLRFLRPAAPVHRRARSDLTIGRRSASRCLRLLP